ncbi:MAG: DUF3108 domain-containing protein [Bacteroidales bacterium]|jgi:hypothetical protein|nr:DUF3108 domain-containing protein [Bacteroidales bacterium]
MISTKSILYIIILTAFVFFGKICSAQELPFKAEEELGFLVYYDAPLLGKVYAGKAFFEIDKTGEKKDGKSVFHAVGRGNSIGTVDFFYKVRDRFESWFDENDLRSYQFIRRTSEGGYIVDDDVQFDYKKGKAISRQDEIDIGESVQDLISSFYFARTLDISSIPIGGNFPLDFYLDDSVYTSVIFYEGKEIVETRLGKFRAMKFKPMVVEGEVFDHPYPMFLWVTDDKNRIPILIKSEVIFGSIKAELFKFKNLKYPLDSKIEKKKKK